MKPYLELGLDTFGDRTNTVSGQPLSHAQTIRNVVEEGVLAEQVGVLRAITAQQSDLPAPAYIGRVIGLPPEK